MPITVSGPNGATIDFPDNTDADTINKVMSEHFGGGQAAAPAAPKYDGSLMGGFARSAVDGATANFTDEGLGLVSGGARDTWRKRANAFEEEHPYIDMAGKVVGAVGSTVGLALTPGGQAPAAANAAGWGMRGLNAIKSLLGVNNAVKAVPGANAAVNLGSRSGLLNRAAEFVGGTNARRGGLAATQYGMTARAGDYEGPQDTPTDGMDGTDHLLSNGVGRLGEAWDLGKMGMDYAGGTAFTKLGNAITEPLSNLSDVVAKARTQSGSKVLAEAARQDGLDVSAIQGLRDSLVPDLGVPRNVTEEAIRINATQGEQAARQFLRQWDATRVNPTTGQPYSTAPQQVGRRVAQAWRQSVGEYQNQNPIDMQLHELMKMQTAGGSGMSLHDLVQKGLNSQDMGEGASQLYGQASQRQQTIGARTRELLDYYLGGDPNMDAASMAVNAERQVRNNERVANALYNPLKEAARNNPEVGQRLQQAIERVRDRLAQEHAGETDDFARTINENLNKFLYPDEEVIMGSMPSNKMVSSGSQTVRDANDEVVAKVQGKMVPKMQELPDGSVIPMIENSEPVTQTVMRGTPNLSNFIGNRSNLGRQIEKLKGQRDPVHAGLSKLKGYLDDEVFGLADPKAAEGTAEHVFQQFRNVNTQRLDAGKLRSAFNMGFELNPQATGGKKLLQLGNIGQTIDTMPVEQQHMFLQGVLAQLKAKLEVKGDFHNVAAMFKNDRMRKLARDFMGDEAASWFIRDIERVAQATRTFNMRTGSPTGRITDHSTIERLTQQMLGFLDLMNPVGALKKGAEYMGETATRANRNSAMEMAGSSTANPDALFRNLDDLITSMQAPPPPNGYGRAIRQAVPFSAPAMTQPATEDYKTGNF